MMWPREEEDPQDEIIDRDIDDEEYYPDPDEEETFNEHRST